MAVKMKSKGTAFLVSISSVYTAIPEIQSISKSEEGGEVYDSSTLDQTYPGMLREATGYSSTPDYTAKLFYDAANAVHIELKRLARTPVATTPFATNFKCTYTNATPTSEVWACPAVLWSEEIERSSGVMATVKVLTSGQVA